MKSRRLVIDASVARAAGEESEDGTVSGLCHDFLSMAEEHHTLVLTRAIWDEWKKHQSGFSRRWLRRMHGARKVFDSDIEPDSPLRQAILATSLNARQRRDLEKDVHLIEGALATDRRIASLDVRVRGLFAVAAGRVRRLRPVLWVNPSNADEFVVRWLETGAPDEDFRRLGYVPTS